MQQYEDLWFRLGYALESGKGRLPALQKITKEHLPARRDGKAPKLLDAFLAVGAGTLMTRLLSLWPGRGRPGLVGLVRAGAAGAAAGLAAELIRLLLDREESDSAPGEELVDVLLAGAGRGLLYAAIVEPRLPGPPAFRGSAYGALEYALTPWGGLEELVGKEAPQRKLPVLAALVQGREVEEPFLAHLAFGILMALLYEG